MAFCTKCGKELKDGDKFCFFCGEPVRAAGGNTGGDARHDNRTKADKGKGNKGKKFSNKQLAGGIAIVLVLFFAVYFFLQGGKGETGSGTELPTEGKAGTASQQDINSEADEKSMIPDVIRNIEDQSGYVGDSLWKPLAAADDFNGDGIQELLAVYEMNSGAGIKVMYDLWSLKESGAQKLKSEVLFQEVGGNSGIVGIVKTGSEPYLAVCQYEPEGELFNNYYTYFSWEKNSSALGDSGYYLECHGNCEQEDQGTYILGDTRVEKSEFDEKYKELDQWVYKLDLLDGAGDGVKTFDQWIE